MKSLKQLYREWRANCICQDKDDWIFMGKVWAIVLGVIFGIVIPYVVGIITIAVFILKLLF